MTTTGQKGQKGQKGATMSITQGEMPPVSSAGEGQVWVRVTHKHGWMCGTCGTDVLDGG
jgi:hypothetical protein